MKLLFLSFLFLAGIGYTYVAQTGLAVFIRGGRIGPGFFPMAISVAFLLITASAIFSELLKMRREGRLNLAALRPGISLDLVVIIGLTLALGLGLTHLGPYTSIFLFLIASLSYFNPRRHLTNIAVSLAVPVVIGLLFQVWLGASIPRGLLY
jgi:putative tricarboxylic transport membrane protein